MYSAFGGPGFFTASASALNIRRPSSSGRAQTEPSNSPAAIALLPSLEPPEVAISLALEPADLIAFAQPSAMSSAWLKKRSTSGWAASTFWQIASPFSGVQSEAAHPRRCDDGTSG